MADPIKLAKFTPTPAGPDFKLHIEDESGQTLELLATREQVDLIADTLDDLLSQDDSADEVEGDDEDIDEDEGDEDALPEDAEADDKNGRQHGRK